MFILDRLELVSGDEMQRILEMFDEADAAKDGVLNLQVLLHPALHRCQCWPPISSVHGQRGNSSEVVCMTIAKVL